MLRNCKDITRDVCPFSIHYMLLIKQNGVKVSLTRMGFQLYLILATGLHRGQVHLSQSQLSPDNPYAINSLFSSYGYNTLNLCLCCEGLRVSHRLTMSDDIKEWTITFVEV